VSVDQLYTSFQSLQPIILTSLIASNLTLPLKIREEKKIPSSQVEFLAGDFFKFEIPAGGFQLVYDYT
jgi:hypothetical protein